MVFIAHYNNLFSALDYADYFKDFNFFKVFGLFFHIFLPRIGVLDELSKDLILGNPIDFNLWVEIPHFFVSYATLAFMCHYALKKKEL
jgi:hypothetical protein